jgi:hypothetical protein
LGGKKNDSPHKSLLMKTTTMKRCRPEDGAQADVTESHQQQQQQQQRQQQQKSVEELASERARFLLLLRAADKRQRQQPRSTLRAYRTLETRPRGIRNRHPHGSPGVIGR